MRHFFLLVSLLLICGCGHKRPAPAPVDVRTGVKPPSIGINPVTGWAGAPVDHGMPLFTDELPHIEYFPPAMKGAILIQRPSVATGYLEGYVSVPTPAILYVALLYQVNDTRLITKEQLEEFAREDWVKTPGIFSTSQPAGETWWWYVYSRPIPAGPVGITSKAIPNGGVFMIGRQH